MFKIKVTGIEDVEGKLNRLEKAVDVEGLLDAAGAILLHRIKERFLRQEAPDGTIWPVSKAAIKRRQTGKDGGTLFDSGALFHSISLGRYGPGKRVIYTNVPYARKHQFGDGVTKRVFLGFSRSDEDSVGRLISMRIREALR